LEEDMAIVFLVIGLILTVGFVIEKKVGKTVPCPEGEHLFDGEEYEKSAMVTPAYFKKIDDSFTAIQCSIYGYVAADIKVSGKKCSKCGALGDPEKMVEFESRYTRLSLPGSTMRLFKEKGFIFN